jgi:homoserine kinase type II
VYYCDCITYNADRLAEATENLVHAADNIERVILRIYNNGGKRDRVAFEHKVLRALAESGDMSFRIPEPLLALDGTSDTYTFVDDRIVSMFRLIPGVCPDVGHAYEFGMAAGELSARLRTLTTTILPAYDGRMRNPVEAASLLSLPTKPYCDLYGVHDAVDRNSFIVAMEGSDFDGVRDAATYLKNEVLLLETELEAFRNLELPMQIIHGDLVYNNVLYDPSSKKVTGLIDFEFTSLDWRAMELAICLSKYAQEHNSRQLFQDFVAGYAKWGRLSKDEIQCVPALIILRLLSNVVYFVGRIISKEDSVLTLLSRIPGYVVRLQFLRSSKDDIVALCHHYFTLNGNLE